MHLPSENGDSCGSAVFLRVYGSICDTGNNELAWPLLCGLTLPISLVTGIPPGLREVGEPLLFTQSTNSCFSGLRSGRPQIEPLCRL